jgi:hypothetical protein
MSQDTSTAPSIKEIIPILHVKSASNAVTWYTKLGFRQDWEHRFQPDFPVFTQISNGAVKIFLSEHAGDARPDTLLWFRVSNVDEFVAALPVDGQGDQVVVEDGERGREAEVRDLDGNRLRVEGPAP